MTGPVLVSLDGSEKDDRALAVAAAVADLSGAPIELVHVIDAPTRHLVAQAATVGVAEDAVTGRREATTWLAESANFVAADAQHDTTSEVLEGTDPAEELIRHATERDALVVVMATRAASLAGLTLVGSVADRVVRECSKPVLLVPPRTAYLQGKRVQFSRVLVPLDGSELATRALDFLLVQPRAERLEYVLIEVVSSGAEVANAEQRLVKAATRIRERLGDRAVVQTRAVESGDTPKAISYAVRELFVELIAMSSRGQSGLRRLVLGSVAEGVVRASEVPVLLVTPRQLAG